MGSRREKGRTPERDGGLGNKGTGQRGNLLAIDILGTPRLNELLVPVHFESTKLGTLNVYRKCSPNTLCYFCSLPLDPTMWRMFRISALTRLFYVIVGV